MRFALNFERGAKALTSLFKSDAREPFADGLQRRGGDNGRAVGNGVVGKAAGGIANDNLLLKENAEPFAGVLVGFREGKSADGDTAAIARNGERDGAEVRRIIGTNQMDGGGALSVNPPAVNGIERPDTVEGKSAGRADARFRNGDGVEGLDGMESNEAQGWNRNLRRHQKSVAEGWRIQ